MLLAPLAGAARADDPSHVLVVEDDGTLFDPPSPLPFHRERLRFTPAEGGGFTTTLEPLEPGGGSEAWQAGERLSFPSPGVPARIDLPFAFPFSGRTFAEMYVHPHGAVSLGEPLDEGRRANAAKSGELLRALAGSPPVVAALWNELLPGQAEDKGGVFVELGHERVTIAWVGVPSVRPADQPNAFRAVLHDDGTVELEYGALATGWGIVGLSPGRDAERISLVDLASAPAISPREAALAWYRDLPRLNEIALARLLYRRLPDRFQFLAVFTDRPVDGPSLVGSVTVKNGDRGIGLPIFDHGPVFGSRNLEHAVLMNDLAFYDDDPSQPPRHPAYAFAPSTLAILAHETGHRWLAGATATAGRLTGEEGHWSFFLDSGGSFVGGSRLHENGDGTFTTAGGFSGFGPLDQYLMGLRPAEEVAPFFVVEEANDFLPPRSASGRPFDAASKPEDGVRFRGTRRDVRIQDVIASTGERAPSASSTPRAFRMAFVLVVSPGAPAGTAEVEKLDRIRRAFGPFFEEATSGRARIGTTLPRSGAPAAPEEDAALRAGEPRILGSEVRSRGRDRVAVKLDFVDFDADLSSVEVSTDTSQNLAPAVVELTAGTHGHRRGTVSLVVRGIASEARELRLTLVDQRGQRSSLTARPLPGARVAGTPSPPAVRAGS